MIVLGCVTAPHGVTGWVRICPFGDDPLSWQRMPAWWLGNGAEWQRMRQGGCRIHGGSLIAKFDGINDRTAAETLRGRLVAAPREALPENRPDEFYWADLQGSAVYNSAGILLGGVVDLIDAGEHHVLRLRDEHDTERLVPFVAQFVRQVDLAAGRIVVEWGADW